MTDNGLSTTQCSRTMDDEPRFNILSQEFDPRVLVEDALNPQDGSARDRFYSSLLGEVADEDLRRSIEDIRDNKITLGRLSHVVYLLPWKAQPRRSEDERTSSQQGTTSSLPEETRQELRSRKFKSGSSL